MTETRAAAYCRVSLAVMGDSTNVDDQEKRCREVARIRGWEVVEVHKDNSKSAWKRNRARPGWDALIAGITEGRFGAIVTYWGDRLVRQPRDLEDLLDAAETKGVRLASVSSSYDLDNPDHQMMLRWEVARSKNEVDHISRRMKEGHARRRERGLVRRGGRGGRAFGFERDGVTHVPGEAAVVREAARRVLNREHTGAVCRDLAARGVVTPAGNPLAHGTLRKLLLRPRYAGLMPDGTTKAAWEPVLDRDTWEAVRSILADKSSAYDYTTNARRYLLTGVAKCGTCGKPVGIRHNTRSESLRGYGCINPACERKVHRSVTHVDAYVEGHVLRLLNDPDFVAELRTPNDPGLAEQITALETRRDKVRATLEELVEHPDEDHEILYRSVKSFGRRISELRERVATSTRRRLLADHAGITLEEWARLQLETRKALVAASYRVTILPSTKRGPGFDTSSVRLTQVED